MIFNIPEQIPTATNMNTSRKTKRMAETIADGLGLKPPQRGHRFASDATG
jgi:hypothetical protein